MKYAAIFVLCLATSIGVVTMVEIYALHRHGPVFIGDVR